MFDRVGVFTLPLEAGDEEAVFEAAIEAGADNCETTQEHHEISCAHEAFSTVRDALQEQFGDLKSGKLAWIPQNTIAVSEEQAATLFKLIDVLEDNDDVQEVCANFEVSDEIMEKLSA